MKKVKIILNVTAVVVAVAGAVITRMYMSADQGDPQYIPVNDSYKVVGEFGKDYNCFYGNGVCTFYRPDSIGHPNEYAPYKQGIYKPVNE